MATPSPLSAFQLHGEIAEILGSTRPRYTRNLEHSKNETRGLIRHCFPKNPGLDEVAGEQRILSLIS